MNASIFGLVLIFPFLLVFLGTSAKYNHEECDQMHEPKMLRSCCKIPHTNEVIKKCRADLLSEKTNDTERLERMRSNKVALKMCIAECEFKVKSYLTAPYQVDFKMIEADLRIHHPQDLDYVQLLLKGYRKCLDYARNKTQELAWMKSPNDCSFFPATLLACATEEVYENCPPQKWHSTPDCEKMRSFLRKCDELQN